MAYRVLAAMVGCRTGNTLGLGPGRWMSIQVDRGGLLPVDCPPGDIAKLIHKGQVEPVDAEVEAELERIRVARYRPPEPPLPASARLVNALSRGGVATSGMHEEFLAALAELVDERVAAVLDGRSSHAAVD